jgi:uncharacterized protein YutE (UPF0331/DUF86 family)
MEVDCTPPAAVFAHHRYAIVELLGQRGILPRDFVAQVSRMPGFRSILAHDYLAVDLGIVWQML